MIVDFEAGLFLLPSICAAAPEGPKQVIPAAQLFPGERGSLLREYWTGIPGGSVANLTASPAYPDAPTALATYGADPAMLTALGAILAGEETARGRLPVTTGDLSP